MRKRSASTRPTERRTKPLNSVPASSRRRTDSAASSMSGFVEHGFAFPGERVAIGTSVEQRTSKQRL